MHSKIKKNLIEKYEKKKPFTEKEIMWMDKQDWHPVDERPLRKEVVQELLKIEKGPFRRTTIDELLGKGS